MSKVWDDLMKLLFISYPYDPHDGREDPLSGNNEHPEQFAAFFYDVGFRLLREVSG